MTPQDGKREKGPRKSAAYDTALYGGAQHGAAAALAPPGAVAVDGVSHLWRKRKRTTQTIFIIIKRQAGQLQSDLECLEHAPHAQSAP
mmetsp:Transcript_713/g.2282  ORF Transcript_713/g.2282 Transcript_713/m.2282 type:complete len:88 (+) Transcript_713:34-297(+)